MDDYGYYLIRLMGAAIELIALPAMLIAVLAGDLGAFWAFAMIALGGVGYVIIGSIAYAAVKGLMSLREVE